MLYFFFFFNDTATTEIYTLSLHDALPISDDYLVKPFAARELLARVRANLELDRVRRTRDEIERSRRLLDQAQRLAKVGDRKSTRLNSSHANISYAVFCLKKKNTKIGRAHI